MGSQSNSIARKAALFALALLLVFGAWRLSSMTTVSAFNVKAEVKDPPGIGNVINKKGEGPAGLVKLGGKKAGKKNVLYINTDIDYGNVYPGEEVSGHFTVYLMADDASVYYTVNITASDSGMSTYLVAQRHYGTGDSEQNDPVPVADGRIGNFLAQGYLDRAAGDTYDEWWVTFYVPDLNGDYSSKIEVTPYEGINVP